MIKVSGEADSSLIVPFGQLLLAERCRAGVISVRLVCPEDVYACKDYKGKKSVLKTLLHTYLCINEDFLKIYSLYTYLYI